MANNETLPSQNGEHIELSHKEITEQHERIKTEHEIGAENNPEKQEKSAESARHEIDNITAEHETKKHENVAEKRIERKIDTKAARKKAYSTIMEQARAEMSAPERAFSKIIHNPAIEKVSDFTGNTIARPDAILSGAISAFLLTLIIYLIAKQSGYPLTGTETIVAFIIGWIVGNIYDYAKIMMRGR